METLYTILRKALYKNLEHEWLFLPKNKEWSLKSHAIMFDLDNMYDEKVDGLLAKESLLTITLNHQQIEDIVNFAQRTQGQQTSDEFLFRSFMYYYKNDAFLTGI